MLTGSEFEALSICSKMTGRSQSSQGLVNEVASPGVKIPLPPRLWITDVEPDSSEESGNSLKEEGAQAVGRSRLRTRVRHHKQRSTSVPIGIFWDIENCQVPRGCSAIDVVSAIRAKFLTGGKREADFVVVCDVRKESLFRIQELNDAQISLIHVCGTQKNAADEKLRQCMRRFGELHSAPAALLLISGDINFAADLSDFRYRKNMEVILVHKQNTSSALIACANSHYDYMDLTANVPRNPKTLSQTEEDEEPRCEMEVANLPADQPAERVGRRLRRLADNCGGKVLRVTASTAILRFPTPDHAHRALKRMDGEDVFGRKISTRYARSVLQPAYSSDEGYSTASAAPPPPPPRALPPPTQLCGGGGPVEAALSVWARALQALPAPSPPPLEHCPPPAPKPRPRRIRGTHGSASLDRSCSSSGSVSGTGSAECQLSGSRAASPWNLSGSASEQSDDEAELTVSNLPPYDPNTLQEMLRQLFSQYVPVVRVSVWGAPDGPLATVAVRSEWDARLAIARVHKRRLDHQWHGRRLELELGRPSPAPSLDVLRKRLRAILLDHQNHTLPLLRLRDAYASRHCCALTTSDLAKIKDTVIVHDGFGRMVQLIVPTPPGREQPDEAPWKCHIHAGPSAVDDGSRILQPVYIQIDTLAQHAQILLDTHGGVVPLLSFVECYESMFPPLVEDPRLGVPLELLLRSASGVEVRDQPARHLARAARPESPPSLHLSESSRSSTMGGERARTAPALEPMLALFERDLVDLLRSAPRCCIPFSKLIPSFHHHFGRQCRVADYGFTKLPDLLAALNNTVVVLGSGSSRVITISAAAQARRWTGDLVKMVKSQGRAVAMQDIPMLYQSTFGVPLSCVEYGVCTLGELMRRASPRAVLVAADGSVSLPRPEPTPDELQRAAHFARQAVEVLCYTPNFRIEFSRFVPSYHAHFGRQLRVAHFGCAKLAELFEMIPESVVVADEPGGERSVQLAVPTARVVMGQRLKTLTPCPLSALPAAYAAVYGQPPQPGAAGARSLEELVLASGGWVAAGLALGPGAAPRWAADQLAAAAVLAHDRSVARDTTVEYLVSGFQRLVGRPPEVSKLAISGVLEACDGRVRLTAEWRCVWRVACLLAAGPQPARDILLQYTQRFDPAFCADVGLEGVVEFLRAHCSVFSERGGLWALADGVALPPLPALTERATDRDRDRLPRDHEYELMDTPPGQKGSRVFESPKSTLISSVWCSPPASALPTPTALLEQDNRRRISLAAQFGAANSTGDLPLINKAALPLPAPAPAVAML